MATTTIELHPKQKRFLESKALFKAFCAGIGSGKSWAGCYDMLRRTKPGRVYMVCAPTFTMLSDSTFRTFCSLARDLGLVGSGDIKKSAPPEMRLRTGSEILFRSADEPDRLRGPNLSGVFLDEASLMPQETFTICIGRLRERGDQGWLSAAFTPRGKKNWCFETFASGKPDTEIIFAKTSDNPFLPPEFFGKVYGQYSSRQRLQELEGQFLDEAGCLFQRAWFPIIEPDAVPPLVAQVRAWDLASTAPDPKKGNDPDWSVGVKLGKDAARTVYVLDVRRTRGTPQQIQQLVTQTASEDGPRVPVYMEEEGGSSGKIASDHYRRLLLGFTFYPVRSTGSKEVRAQPVAAAAEGGLIKVVRASWTTAFLDIIEAFPFGTHDDDVDATSLGLGKLAWYDGADEFDCRIGADSSALFADARRMRAAQIPGYGGARPDFGFAGGKRRR